MRGDETIVIYEPGEENWEGDPADDDAPGTTIAGCVIWPRESSEEDSGGRKIIDGLNVFIPPPNRQISADASVLARGKTYVVDGVPGEYRLRRDRGVLLVLARTGGA